MKYITQLMLLSSIYTLFYGFYPLFTSFNLRLTQVTNIQTLTGSPALCVVMVIATHLLYHSKSSIRVLLP